MKRIKIIYKVREVRKAKGMSIRDLAAISGVSKSQICRIENNLMHPTMYTLCLLADALGVEPEELYFSRPS